MAVTGPPARPAGLARYVRSFILTVAGGIAAFTVIALFTASGQAHVFAEGAVLAGLGIAVLSMVLRVVGPLIGLVALIALFDDILGR